MTGSSDEAADDATDDLRSYYEREASGRCRGPLRGLRLEVRGEFLARLATEGRTSVLDVGAGPGLDGAGFLEAGHRFVGVDLAHGNGVLAAEVGVSVVQGSLLALPIRPRSFDAGWSFSTLMHVPASGFVIALAEILRAVRPGAPVAVGLWGSEDEATTVDEAELPGHRRPFHLRSFERNEALLASRAEIESAERFAAVNDGSDYHVFLVRADA